MLYINASFKDAIERVASLIAYCKEIPIQEKTIEYDLDETDIGFIKKILCENDINNCQFSDNCLVLTLPLSTEEIAEKQAENTSCAKYWASRLVKCSNLNEEFRLQIEQYLQKYAGKYSSVITMMEEYKQSISQKGN